MTVRIHPADDPSAFADRLLALLVRSALSRMAADPESSAGASTESEPPVPHSVCREVSPP